MPVDFERGSIVYIRDEYYTLGGRLVCLVEGSFAI
jgi:hypothetical protein